MRDQGTKAVDEVVTAPLGTPANHVSPPPNVAELARFLHTFQNPGEIRSSFVSLIKVSSNKGNDTLAELEIGCGDIAARFHESHLNK